MIKFYDYNEFSRIHKQFKLVSELEYLSLKQIIEELFEASNIELYIEPRINMHDGAELFLTTSSPSSFRNALIILNSKFEIKDKRTDNQWCGLKYKC